MNRALFLLTVLTVFLSSAFARSVFEPHIVESKDDAVCNLFIEHYQKEFRTEAKFPSGLIKSKKISRPSFTAIPGDHIQGDLYVADIEIEGSKKIFVKYRYYKTIYDAYLSRFYLFNHENNKSLTSRFANKDQIESRYFFTHFSDESNDMEMRMYDGNYPVKLNGNWYYAESNSGDNSLNVFTLHKNSSSEMVCQLKIYPTLKSEHVTKLPFFATYKKTLENIMLSSGDCGSKSGPQYRAKASGELLATMIVYRPWAIKSTWVTRKSFESRIKFQRKHFNDWQFQDIWSYREFDTYLNAKANAINELAGYFNKSYSYSKAKAKDMAKTLVDIMPGHYYSMGQSFDTEKDLTIYQKLVDGTFRRWNEIDTIFAIDFNQPAEWPNRCYHTIANPITALTFLADSSHLLEKLSVEQRHSILSSYGKDLLMYSAHMNNLDSTKYLLDFGWNPNAVTHQLEACKPSWRNEFCLNRTHRSALTYAAENASIELIKALIDAGADTSIKDSQDNTLDFYIKLNPRFSDVEKALGFDDLMKKYAESSQIKPGFACLGKLNRVEHAICDSEGLSIYDRELATNYRRAMKNEKIARQLKKDQIRWIGNRNRECKAFEKDFQVDACIARTTRARIRYLEYLLEVLSE